MSFFYLVNQKAPKTIESPLTRGGTKPAFSKYFIETKKYILARRKTKYLLEVNPMMDTAFLWKSFMSTSLIVLKIFLTLKQVMTILGVWFL